VSPTKTLRYYNDIGLFTPCDTDRFTSYRYYTLDQLPTIHRIMALKELGLSLDEIVQLTNADLSPEQFHDMLLLKQEEVQQRVDEELGRLALVKFHLRQIESKRPDLQIVVKKLEPFHALTLRSVFPTQKDIDSTGHEILHAVASGALRAVAVPMGISYSEEFTREDIDYEFVLPIDAPQLSADALESRGTLEPREVPGIDMAATYVYTGDYDGLNDALVSLQRWAVENGYRLGSEMRMIYFRGPMHNVPPAEYITELQHQIEKI
jgi:DNA-binding transcriptional MerR regulator